MKNLMLIVRGPQFPPTEPERWFAYTHAMREAEEWAARRPTNGPVEVWPVLTFD